MEASSLYNLTSNSYMVIVHILFIQKQYSLIVSVHLDDHIIELHLKLLSQTELYNFNPPMLWDLILMTSNSPAKSGTPIFARI
jgi:hypothetical protein